MSDHLERLAARALGTAPTIRPRLPARFEPLAPGMFSAADDRLALEQHDEIDAPAPVPQPARQPKQDARRATPAHSRPSAPDDASAAASNYSDMSPVAPGAPDPPPSAPQFEEPPRLAGDFIATPPISAHAQPAASHLAHDTTVREAEPGSPAMSHVAAPPQVDIPAVIEAGALIVAAPLTSWPATRDDSLDDRPAAVNDVSQTREHAPSPMRRDQPRSSRSEPATPRAAARPSPHTTRRAPVGHEADSGRWADAASDTPETTIQITIGRVEIRAAPAANEVRPPRGRGSAPALGLDEYLRRRATGGLP